MGISVHGEYDTEATNNDAIPPGVYTGHVIEADRQPCSKADPSKGDQLVLTWQLANGRLLWQQIKLWYDGPDDQKAATTRRMASAMLGDVAQAATGRREISDTDDLLHRDCELTVDVREYNGREYNDVKKVKGAGKAAKPEPSRPSGAPGARPGGAKPAGNRFAAARAARTQEVEDEVPF